MSLRKKIRALRNESGSGTFIMILMLIPLLCGLVGVAMDYSYATYMRNSLQASLDSATSGAAIQLANTADVKSQEYEMYGNNAYFDNDADLVLGIVKAAYEEDRVNYPALQDEQYFLDGSVRASQVVNGRAATPVVSALLHESTETFFMHYFGVERFEYTLTSEARLGFDVDNKPVAG